jgi:hypothetical protein
MKATHIFLVGALEKNLKAIDERALENGLVAFVDATVRSLKNRIVIDNNSNTYQEIGSTSGGKISDIFDCVFELLCNDETLLEKFYNMGQIVANRWISEQLDKGNYSTVEITRTFLVYAKIVESIKEKNGRTLKSVFSNQLKKRFKQCNDLV